MMNEPQTTQNLTLTASDKLFEEMMKAGVHYGRAKKYTHPSMKPFLIKTVRNIEIFNLNFTLQKLNELSNALAQTLKEGKKVLFVGVAPASALKIKEIAQKFNQPYLNYKWVGGFLTNFQTILSRLAYFKELLQKEASGELKEYPPKERSRLERELNKMKLIYEGVKDMEKLPDAVFIVNLAHKSHLTAKREALKMNLPIFAIAGSDNDITNVKYFVPANDKAPRSIDFLLSYIMSKVESKLTPNLKQETSSTNG